MEYSGKAIWITWHEHRRTRSLVEKLDIETFVFDDHRTLQRYTIGPLWTLSTLIRENPDIIFTHLSYFLQLILIVYKYLFRFGRVKIVCDCHNKALKLELTTPLKYLFNRFKKSVFSGVDLIIVTNISLLPFAHKLCKNATILRDPLTNWEGEDSLVRQQDELDSLGHVFFICSFDKDEPIELIFNAANSITEKLGFDVFISGNPPLNEIPEKIRENNKIFLPGFMPIAQYKKILFTASAVVVLTEDQDCLVCGAYESLGALRPTVLSTTPALKTCFGQAAQYALHNEDDIVEQIKAAVETTTDPEIPKQVFENAWLEEWEKLQTQLNLLSILNPKVK